jgi:hypothetical protein
LLQLELAQNRDTCPANHQTALADPTEPTAIPIVSAEAGESAPSRSTTPTSNVVIRIARAATDFAVLRMDFMNPVSTAAATAVQQE